MSADAARARARRKLGNTTLVREEIYQMNTISLVDSAWRDLKHGARLLRLNPAFAVVAVLSLALGIGANTAIFQLLDAVAYPGRCRRGAVAARRRAHRRRRPWTYRSQFKRAGRRS
jgi:hypothetical protein